MIVRVLGVMFAAVFAGAGLWWLTPTQRRRSAAIGGPWWFPLVMIVVGAACVWAAVVESVIPMILGGLLLLAAGFLARRRRRGRGVPPAVARMESYDSDPVALLLHPVVETRRLFHVFGHPLRNKRETDQWFRDRGL